MTTTNQTIQTLESIVGNTKSGLDAAMGEPFLVYGNRYNFKHQPERLVYVGKWQGWHQFEKINEHGVWCELLDSDLHMIEKTKADVVPANCEVE
jgi:hypothetical protein